LLRFGAFATTWLVPDDLRLRHSTERQHAVWSSFRRSGMRRSRPL